MSIADQATGSELEGLQAIFSDLQRSPLLDKFVSLWNEMGIEGSNLVTRQDAIRLHVHNLMEDMYKEELVLKEKLIDSVSQCAKELTELCIQLSVPFNGPSEALPLATREKELRQKVDNLTKEKHSRLKRLKRLAELESAMCKCVGEQTQLGPVMQSGEVPSDKDLQTYREMVARLEQIKNERQEEFLSIRKKVLKLWEELEVQPHHEFERHVASGDINHFGLSVENMAKLHKFHTELEEEATHLEARAHQLRESINSLWQRLEVPQEERDVFTHKYLGHKPKIIAALCEEMSRLDEMKKEHMQKFVEATRTELHVVWDQCMYGPQQRQEFIAAFKDDFSEELLSAHESELDRMKGFYQDNLEVFQMIRKRDKLWHQQLDLDKQATDPNRFNNRGGQLQKQLKLRKQLERDLPKLEKELKSVLLQWEEDHERYFMVEDSRYIDAMEAKMKVRFQEKEKEKIKKKRNKEEALKFEMTYGSRPSTPVKSAKRQAGGTPAGDSCKQRRVGPSPVSSAQRATLKRATSKRPGLPTPTGRKKPTSSRRILTEKNVRINPEESVLSQANISLASTGTYTDFQRGLVAGMESQKPTRSSAIPKSSSAQNLANKKMT